MNGVVQYIFCIWMLMNTVFTYLIFIALASISDDLQELKK